MNIISQEKNTIELAIQSGDDLWALSKILDVGDLVRAQTTRKIRLDGGNEKQAKYVI